MSSFRASVAALIIGSSAVSAQRIVRVGRDARLDLPPAMATALRAFDSTFAPHHLTDFAERRYERWCDADGCHEPDGKITSRDALFAVIGDFNGDRTLDVVVHGDNGREGMLLAIMSAGRRFRVEKIHIGYVVPDAIRQFQHRRRKPEEWELELTMGLNLVRPGVYASYDPEFNPPLRLTTDAVEVGHFDSAAHILYYRNGRWHTFATGD